jgi:sigma-B regulation protein RsbU (phosphoserine phosphatase)
MVDFSAKSPLVLVVEDDPHSRSFMESSLKLSGFSVVSADSVESAREICQQTGLDAFFTIISDYRLPEVSGTEFLQWIRSEDSSLSTIIITGQGEKSIVEQSIAVGVFRYLEKPVTHQELREVIWSAVEQTRLQRKYASDRKGLQALEHLGQSLNVVIPESQQDRMTVVYRPLHEVGGDFFITHEFDEGRFVFLLGDISGHDIRSGYVSTYFQGMFRGSLEGDARISKAMDLFNRSLRQHDLQDESGQGSVSLTLSALDCNPQEDYIKHWNFGFTPCLLVSEKGSIKECPYGHFPLGWMEGIDTTPISLPVQGNSILYIFTDGLSEFANSLRVNSFSLLYRLLHPNSFAGDLQESPTDDILIVRYLLNPAMTLSQTFEPILSEHYAGSELEHIDHLQANWRRCITFALGDRLGDRLYDLLICIREGMINAFTHGCEGSEDKFAHLQISINEDKDLLRVFIDDPGRGHTFDLAKRLDQLGEQIGKHLGLGIIHHLSDELQVDNNGTSLVFDFEVNPEN